MNHRNTLTQAMGLMAGVGVASIAVAFAGCSSDDSSATPVVDSGTPGNDATTNEDTGTSTPDDSGTPTPDSGSDAGNGIAQKVTQTNLVADTADAAANIDPNLVNPWGLAFNPSGPAWVADNHTGISGVYRFGGDASILNVTIPLPPSAPADAGQTSAPTGQIFNATADFKGDKFLFATEDGTVAGWQSGTSAVVRVDSSAAGARYKGLAIVASSPQILLAADFHNGHIDAFNADYTAATPAAGKWADPSVPAGYAPFNIVASGTQVYVAYAKQDAQAGDEIHGAGLGAVSVFDTGGTLVKSLVKAGGALNAPWGLATVGTGGWGALPAGTLLVGDFGDGEIQAFNATGALVGKLVDAADKALKIDGLWAIAFGAQTDAGETNKQLYFTAGPSGEEHGLYGYLTTTP